jgi:hypothetical protein
MKVRHWRLLGVAVLAAPLAVMVPAMAAEVFGDWDTSGDGIIDSTEWGIGFDENTAFDSWDADHDGNLTETEFRDGVFGAYDDNDDGNLDEPEFGDYGDDLGDGGLWDV